MLPKPRQPLGKSSLAIWQTAWRSSRAQHFLGSEKSVAESRVECWCLSLPGSHILQSLDDDDDDDDEDEDDDDN